MHVEGESFFLVLEHRSSSPTFPLQVQGCLAYLPLASEDCWGHGAKEGMSESFNQKNNPRLMTHQPIHTKGNSKGIIESVNKESLPKVDDRLTNKYVLKPFLLID